jgi:cytochrome c oxidase accessory protein FixG
VNEFELHPDRLATTDETGKRVYLYPADVRGFFRRWKSRVQLVLIVFFLVLPWIQIDGRQALLLDISRRHFEFFGLSLRAHNAPLLFFVFAIAGFGLFFVTAIWGRIWCGWACPQTVFIEGVFRRIERWIEGPALERRRMEAAPWGVKKISKRTLKWSLYLAASLVITHSFLAYFVGTDRLAEMITRPPSENWLSFLFIVASTGIILFDFAWFREQFCIIACPYGRFQSVLMDEHSTIVAYDPARGEPRATPQAKALSKAHGTQLGDCVNCYRCVQVCPTGIDIRRGVQMECIACTSCIDACDEVMTKIKKPTGMIRYDSLTGLQKNPKAPRKVLRARPAVYLAIASSALIALSALLATMKPVEITVLRAKEAPYTLQESPGQETHVLNHFKIELSNQSNSLRHLFFELKSPAPSIELITAHKPFPLEEGQMRRADVFMRFPKSLLENGQLKLQLLVRNLDPHTGEELVSEKEVTLVGPF